MFGVSVISWLFCCYVCFDLLFMLVCLVLGMLCCLRCAVDLVVLLPCSGALFSFLVCVFEFVSFVADCGFVFVLFGVCVFADFD